MHCTATLRESGASPKGADLKSPRTSATDGDDCAARYAPYRRWRRSTVGFCTRRVAEQSYASVCPAIPFPGLPNTFRTLRYDGDAIEFTARNSEVGKRVSADRVSIMLHCTVVVNGIQT
jgi:hypothetical protein